MGKAFTVILNEMTVIPKFCGTRLIRGYIGIQNNDERIRQFFGNLYHVKAEEEMEKAKSMYRLMSTKTEICIRCDELLASGICNRCGFICTVDG